MTPPDDARTPEDGADGALDSLQAHPAGTPPPPSERSPRVLASLAELFETMDGETPPEEGLARVLRFTLDAVPAAGVAAVLLEDGGRPTCRMALHRTEGRLAGFKVSGALLEALDRDRAHLLLPRIGDPSASQRLAGVTSALLVPLKSRGSRVGLLYLDNRGSGGFLRETDLHICQALAAAASLQVSFERQMFLSRVEGNMQRYFGPEVVRFIVEESRSGRQVALGVRECEATIVFVDMAGFSALSRLRTPQQIVDVLNPYYDLVTRRVQAHGGHVDKFLGDGVLAVFGVTLPGMRDAGAGHASRALAAACDLIEEWAERRARGEFPEAALRVGVDSGRVVAGNIGSQGRMEFSVIGDAVNCASRLEKFARPDAVALSERVAERARGLFELEPGDRENVRSFGEQKIFHLAPLRGGPGERKGWRPGDLVEGLYEVRGLLGRGGMGAVYRVRHRLWGVDLAVKRPAPEVVEAAGGLDRFVREAENWVSLPMHPNVATAHYVRVIDGAPAIFAECVEGADLHSWRDGKAVPLEAALEIAVQVCWGMGVAHRHGLIHRDLKPLNVLIGPDGEAKVTDFGLAKSVEGADEEADGEAAEGEAFSTRSGAHVGTAAYMPPEQWENRVVPASDIYAFGVMLFEMLCGRLPFEPPEGEAAAPDAYRRRHLNEALPDPRRWAPEVPEGLAALLERCLAKDPAARPPHFEALAAELTDVMRELGREPRRRDPGQADARAAELNNRALSMLDLGRRGEARRLLEEALTVDPRHIEATYTRATLDWAAGRLDDLAVLSQVAEAAASRPGSAAGPHMLGLIHLARGDAASAASELERARGCPDADAATAAALETARRMRDDGSGMTLVLALQDHRGYVRAVAASPDGRRVVTASLDRSIRAWDAASGALLSTLGGLEATEFLVTSRDGDRLYSEGVGGDVAVWSLSRGRCLARLEGHAIKATSAAEFPDGRRLASAGADGALRVWDLADSSCLRVIAAMDGTVFSLAVSPDGERLLSGGGDGSVKLWHAASGNCMALLAGHAQAVVGAAFLPRNAGALTASWDGTVRLWDLSREACLRTWEAGSPVTCLAVSQDGRRFACGTLDKKVRVFDARGGRCVRTFTESEGSIYCLAFTPDGRRLAAGGSDKAARLWSLAGDLPDPPRLLARPTRSEEAARRSRRVADLRRAASGHCEAGRWREAWASVAEARAVPGYERDPELLALGDAAAVRGRRSALAGGWPQRTIKAHSGAVCALEPAPDERAFLSAGVDGRLRLWDAANGRPLWSADAHPAGRVDAAFTSGGRTLVSGGADGSVRLWDAASGRGRELPAAHPGGVLAVAAAGALPLAVSTGEDGKALVWNLSGEGRVLAVPAPAGRWAAAALTPDGSCCAFGGEDGSVLLWSARDGRVLRRLEGHGRSLRRLQFSPDGSLLASGADDGELRLWDAATGACRSVRSLGDAPLVGLALSGDSSHALCALRGSGVLLPMRLEDGCSGRLQGRVKVVSALALFPSARFALAGGEGGDVDAWRLDWEVDFDGPPAEAAFLDRQLRSLLETTNGRCTERDAAWMEAQCTLRGLGSVPSAALRARLKELAREFPARRAQWLSERCGA